MMETQKLDKRFKNRLIDIRGYLKHETSPEVSNEGAFLVETYGNTICNDYLEIWLPKYLTEKSEDDSGIPNMFVFTVPEEFAVDKGIL